MMSGWEEKKLGEVAKATYGYTESASYKEIGPKFLRITDIQNDGVNWETVPFCKISNADLGKYTLKDGDIVFARTGATTGKCFLIRKPPTAVFASYLIKLHITEKGLLPDYLVLFFQTKTYWDTINAGVSGSAQGGFNATKLSELKIPLPPLPEQKRIVAILDEAFSGIARAKEIAEKNLANAKEVFNSYLHSISTKKRPLGESVNITTGKLDSNAAVENGKYPFFTCSRQIFAIDKFAFDCEAILLAGNNAVGDFNVKHYKGKFNAYQRTYVLTIKDEKAIQYRHLYYQMLKSLKEFKEKSVGAGTKFLKLGMIQDLEIALPSFQEQTVIVSSLDDLLEKSQKLESIYRQKLASLEELKKSILAKAFSGALTGTAS
jgi:type I restriction enzyme, S subunit